MLKTISLALIADSPADSTAATRHALELAERMRAHLCVRVGVPPLIVPTLAYTGYASMTQMVAILEQENVERRQQAEQMSSSLQDEAKRLGVVATIEVVSAAYDPLPPHFIRMARASDVCLMQKPPAEEPQQRDILVDVLFGSGAPLLLVPSGWSKPGRIGKAIVAWDGGAAVARAIRDAIPLLAEADMVEIVTFLGEKEIHEAEASSSDIARHLARHCREVCINVSPVGADGVAAALFARAALTGANLVVMGGYGHSRFREFVLGGVTRDALTRASVPTLLSH